MAIKKQGGYGRTQGALIRLKASQKMGGGQLTENLRASPFNNDLSNETTFSLIHLAGQYL
jgi:hypothetical protein